MSLTVDVRHTLGAFQLEASFASAGRLTALFGPSGSGKTTLVNLIGGLIRPEHARIAVGGRTLVDTNQRLFTPAHKRRIGYVFQDARLFPHLSVRQNLLYGRWFTPLTERTGDISHIIELLGLAHLLERKPSFLSGGEKQRVAIGRALLASPRLLLMDEPLASLDDARKAEIMPYIERLRDETETPIVYVSHSIAEVSRLATDIVVMASGRVTAAGPAGVIMQRLDLLPPEEQGQGGAILETRISAYDKVFDMSTLHSAAGEIHVPGNVGAIGQTMRVRLRARDVMISTQRPEGLSALNILEGEIVEMGSQSGAMVELRLACGGEAVVSRITRQSLYALQLAPGMKVFAVIKAVAFDPDSHGATRLRAPLDGHA